MKIGDLSAVATGGTPATGHPEYYGGDIRWLKSGDVKGLYISEVLNRITDLGLANSNAKVHPIGTVMLAMSGQGKTRGSSAILKVPSACSQSVAAILPSDIVIPEIIHFALAWLYEDIRRITGKYERTGLNLELIQEITIPVPPSNEQKYISEALLHQMSAIEELKITSDHQQDAIMAMPRVLLREVFDSEEARQWPVESLGELVINYDGLRVPVKQKERLDKKGIYPYYGASGIIDHVDGYLFDGDYLLIAEDGANLITRSTPIAFRASGKFWVNNHAHVVQPKDSTLLDYLKHYLASIDLKPYITGAAQPKLNQKDMNRIPVPVPTLNIQERIVASLNSQISIAEKIRQKTEEQREAIDAFPAAVLREVFGESASTESA